MSQPGEYATQRAPMSGPERDKLERRLLTQIKANKPLGPLMRTFKLSETRIRRVAERHGLTITRGSGGNRL